MHYRIGSLVTDSLTRLRNETFVTRLISNGFINETFSNGYFNGTYDTYIAR